MADHSGIQWTDATWNPVTGCSKVSPGCAHCYAETIALRLWATSYPKVLQNPDDPSASIFRPRQFTDVQCHEDRLDQPLRWKKPRRIFVNSMSDLLHEDVPDAFIDRVFAVMALAPQHTFQVLTKRAERMRDYMRRTSTIESVYARACRQSQVLCETWQWPLPNVWLGVSVENQHFADERIPLLLQTPAAVRFISAEPLLGSLGGLDQWLSGGMDSRPYWTDRCPVVNGFAQIPGIDWVIIGGESGPCARPFDLAWARSIVAQCQQAGVPVFVKQLGAAPRTNEFDGPVTEHGFPLTERPSTTKIGGLLLRDRKGGDPFEWPADLQVREFPASAGAVARADDKVAGGPRA